MVENAFALLLCNLLLGAETEARHEFANIGDERAIRVDCETPTHVIELGLDEKPSNRDSIHQAVFAAHLTGKAPMVLLIDTDGEEGRYEYEMRIVATRLGVTYGVCKAGFLQRWAATAGLRGYGAGHPIGDLPSDEIAKRHCDIAPALSNPVVN